jgi:glycerol-3-phosphate dehydrogenase (NAD(P)+)|tara:strand:+ start:812 stop:1807 length:996 start_codon:yes stop_codon:yes gene_type:complete
MSFNKNIGVLGAGSWGTALVKMLSENCDKIFWYSRNDIQIKEIIKTKKNPKYLKDLEIDTDKISISSDLNFIIDNSDILIIAIPSPYIEKSLNEHKTALANKIIFSGSKGVIPESHLVITEHLHKEYNIPYKNLGILSGPTHAEEIAKGKLSYLTVGSSNDEISKYLSKKLFSPYVHTSLSNDVIGIEYAATLKNIYSILVGISFGLGYGDNFISVLISHCTKEMINFIKSIDNVKREFSHSAYIGDLLVTTYSKHSRNRTFGEMIGEGLPVKKAISKMSMIVEGYYATKNAYEISKSKNMNFEIIKVVHEILYNNKNAELELKLLAEKLN